MQPLTLPVILPVQWPNNLAPCQCATLPIVMRRRAVSDKRDNRSTPSYGHLYCITSSAAVVLPTLSLLSSEGRSIFQCSEHLGSMEVDVSIDIRRPLKISTFL